MMAVHTLLKFVHGDRLTGPMTVGPCAENPLGKDMIESIDVLDFVQK
jgi:hypothetical protein